jgi:hypothetical protein
MEWNAQQTWRLLGVISGALTGLSLAGVFSTMGKDIDLKDTITWVIVLITFAITTLECNMRSDWTKEKK